MSPWPTLPGCYANAEVETNHATMERLEQLADTWVNIANLLRERERV